MFNVLLDWLTVLAILFVCLVVPRIIEESFFLLGVL